MQKPIIISIEGNIGAGKTTILKNLEILLYTDPSIVFLREPVDIWQSIKDKQNNNILAKFYDDPKKYAFSFQVMAFVTRLTLLRQTIDENPNCKVIICERSLEADKHIFAKMLYDDGMIDDINYQVYMCFYEEYRNLYKLDGIVYIEASADICHERISKRGRAGEELVALDYLRNCEKYHEEWLGKSKNNPPVLKINTEEEVTYYSEEFGLVKDNAGFTWLEHIKEFVYDLRLDEIASTPVDASTFNYMSASSASSENDSNKSEAKSEAKSDDSMFNNVWYLNLFHWTASRVDSYFGFRQGEQIVI